MEDATQPQPRQWNRKPVDPLPDAMVHEILSQDPLTSVIRILKSSNPKKSPEFVPKDGVQIDEDDRVTFTFSTVASHIYTSSSALVHHLWGKLHNFSSCVVFTTPNLTPTQVSLDVMVTVKTIVDNENYNGHANMKITLEIDPGSTYARNGKTDKKWIPVLQGFVHNFVFKHLCPNPVRAVSLDDESVPYSSSA
ncbi:hypothetical protein PTSG_13007 [Salpingoeca rosetta]|uniref:Uncharacterized protein n=1 Tax=Salpingoeca rosetta (strain ATCC 50818 / BSB-021) TaxID=946362 RepID=F2UQK9_SALR5|nr:uncharacterized protein PTSG_13007 [Salpingoeca rosetta]EGD79914.1 hypothetical protein PTSG_13007 [Salpingoeca rosetta]|eukprot:XP_004988535.1 hypothetical protein PTSG_13007 [Salpingoeca rosetta]